MSDLCECFCADCETICPPDRMAAMEETCVYCFERNRDLAGEARWKQASAVEAVQPAAVEEARHPADWYVDPNAPDGCA